MRRWLVGALVVAVVGAGVVLRSQEVFEPWNGLHKGWGGAVYGNIARNLVRYGPLETRLAPLTNTGPVASRDEWTYYYHYPPLLVGMVAASFRVFGVHEASARLVPLAFSLLTLGLAYLFARRFWSNRIALLALMVIAFLPVETYYADHVDVYGPPAAFFSALAIVGYAWWFEDRRPRYLGLCFGALVAGCLMAWYAYFAAALLAAHALWAGPRDRRPARWIPVALVACGVVVFTGFLLHRRSLLGGGGGEVYGTLLEKLLARTGYFDLAIPTTDGLVPIGPAGFVKHLIRDVARMHGPLTLVLAASWLLTAASRAARRVGDARDGFLLMLLGYGLVHGLAFPMLLPGHEFLSRCFSVGLAVAAAVAMDGLGCRLFPGGPLRAAFATGLLVVLVTASNVALGRRLVVASVAGDEDMMWGTHVREATHPETVVLWPGRANQILEFYLDRRTGWGITSPESLDSALVGVRHAAVAIAERDVGRFPALAGALDAQAPSTSWRGLRLYTIERDPELR